MSKTRPAATIVPSSGDDAIAETPVRLIGDETADGRAEQAIALCLSGGGYRAMLFHLGALWRLNEAGVLPKLRRVSSVSGGSITAAVLGLGWHALGFDSAGVAQNFGRQVVDPLRKLADRTIDRGCVIRGLLLPGTISERVAAAYDKHIFRGRTLADLPDDRDPSRPSPRFVINATNVQTGSLWRFSRPYMGDWQVGLIRDPKTPLATAVAASSSFPPVLSPCRLDVDPAAFDRATLGLRFEAPLSEKVVLSDGGVYDNLGLETAYKRCTTLLVSDGGQKKSRDPAPEKDWVRHSIRVMGLIDNQVRSLRKRQLIRAYQRGDRAGGYWGIATEFGDFNVPDLLGVSGLDPISLAGVPTRLAWLDSRLQERLINWGYAVCDACLRAHAGAALLRFGIAVAPPRGFPFPASTLP